MNKNEIAYIIGNGKSRKGFPLDMLRDKGVSFGCNGIWKEYAPNYLVTIDDKYIKIAYESDFPQHKIIVPMEQERFELSGTGRRSNAGMNAMHEAIKRNCKILYCMGFDFLVKDNTNISLSNMYEGQIGYEPDTRANQNDNINRVEYLNWFTKHFSSTQFVFLYPRGEIELYELKSPNVMGMFYDDFIKELKK